MYMLWRFNPFYDFLKSFYSEKLEFNWPIRLITN